MNFLHAPLPDDTDEDVEEASPLEKDIGFDDDDDLDDPEEDIDFDRHDDIDEF